MPERLECEVLQKVRYINTLTFTFVCEQHARVVVCIGVTIYRAVGHVPPPLELVHGRQFGNFYLRIELYQ